MIQLRPDQRTTVDKGLEILRRYNLLYLACQPRTGKSIMSLTIAKEMGWRRVLFLTTKKAISSVKADYAKSGFQFTELLVLNYEQMRTANKPNDRFDGYILDESTVLSRYPKPGATAKEVKSIINKKPVILMSGTPTPESYSQIFHQLWVSYYSPFSPFKNFYAWAKEYVKVAKKYVRGIPLNDYSGAKETEIKEVIKYYMVTLSQEEAGFNLKIKEDILWVDIDPRLYQLMAKLKKERVYKMKAGNYIVCDTPAKMQQVFHQISSGTVISEDGARHTLDESKAKRIKEKFAGQKIAIFYLFVQEGELLRRIFPMHTDIPEVFNERDDVTFICQAVSGRMGINLSTADHQVMYNIPFSATTYFQIIERTQDHKRTKECCVWWTFSRDGIEKFVYKAVSKKKSYTNNYFKKDFKL